MSSETKIHNGSDETISLIAFSRRNGVDIHSAFDVKKNLARNIPAGKSELVKPNDYNSSRISPHSQIHMLFRCGEHREIVTPRQGEKVFVYSQLGQKPEWRLSLDSQKQVNGGPGSAVGPSSSGANAAGPQDKSLLERLNEQVQKLQKTVEALMQKVKELEGLLPKKK